MIPLFEPYVNEQARRNVERVLLSTQLAEGPEVKAFEAEFAEVFGFEPWQIVSLNSGTSALELAYDITGIGEGDEVITPVLTCTATNLPLVRRRAQIVFGDVEGITHLNLDPDHVARNITRRTKAIVFVHFGGSSAGLAEVQRIAEQSRIPLICDGAQVLGGTFSQSARFTVVSLQAIKSLTAGDGGVLICRSRGDALRARRLRWYGYDREEKQRLGDTDLTEAGYKFHMNDISAAIARGNLSEWDRIIEHRRAIVDTYQKHFESRAKRRGVFIPGIWNPQVIDRSMDFPTLQKLCEHAGFQIGQYHYPNYKYSVFRSARAHCPNMRMVEGSYFLLPCHMGMTLIDAERIAEALWGSA